MNLNPGDPCRVRLHDGKVVEAEYYMPSSAEKCHSVTSGNDMYLAIGGDTLKSRIRHNSQLHFECIFVGKPCVLEPV
jgi:hypothetical protein